MENSQLNNLINFCFNFHKESGNSFIDCDATYILEKWSKYIGVKPLNKEIKNSNIINPYIEKWKINTQTKWNQIKEIIDFLSSLNQKSLLVDDKDQWSLEDIVKLFEEKTGIFIYQITESEYHNIHPTLRKEVERWKLLPINDRYFKLKIIGI